MVEPAKHRENAMHRRSFCKNALAAGVAASLAGYRGAAADSPPDRGAAIPAVSSNGAELSIETAAVAELAAALQGRLFLQGDKGYARARTVWNGMFDNKRPAMVAQCVSTADVVSAVDFARERDLLVSVKGGGHSLPGKSTSDGGLMIDLSRMHAVEIDADAQHLRVDGGALLGHLDRAALARELMTTTGIVSHTGVGGFTLGGGFGRTDRKMGLAIDNLLAATVVTAAGNVVHASEDENPDLFWGLRGGGGNFGIATEFIYRLHPFNPTVFGGNLVYPLTRDFLAFYAEFNESLPDEVNLEPQLMPNDEGKPVIVAQATCCGDHAAGAKALAPLREFPGLLSGELGPLSFEALQTGDDEFFGHGRQYYLKSGLLNELTPDAIDVIVEYAGRAGPASWFQHLGGASARVAPAATAYPHRGAAFNFGIMYIGDEPSGNDAGRAAVREYYAAMEPHMAGFYTNLNEDSADRTQGNYGANYPRLVGLKNRYDPTNLFRLNANIQPSA
jgi:FAD/FMN-containing dehydrogenase